MEEAEDHHQPPDCQGSSSQDGLALEKWHYLPCTVVDVIKVPFNVLFQGACLWCFYRSGKCGARNDHIPGNFLFRFQKRGREMLAFTNALLATL